MISEAEFQRLADRAIAGAEAATAERELGEDIDRWNDSGEGNGAFDG